MPTILFTETKDDLTLRKERVATGRKGEQTNVGIPILMDRLARRIRLVDQAMPLAPCRRAIWQITGEKQIIEIRTRRSKWDHFWLSTQVADLFNGSDSEQ